LNISGFHGPSALLAMLSFAIYEWDAEGKIPRDWISRVDGVLAHEATVTITPSTMEATQLSITGVQLINSLDGVGDPHFDQFLAAVRVLQLLDEWHEPLALEGGMATALSDDHEEALWRLQVEGGAYNPKGSWGSVIPARAPGVERTVSADDAGVVARLLHFTAYLPPESAAGDPDDSAAPSGRHVELRYVASMPRRSIDPRAVEDAPTIAVSPVLQDLSDAEITVRRSPDRYGVEVKYDPSRLKDIVSKAIKEKARLLFMPEMVINAHMIADLAKAIRKAVSEWFDISDDLPTLRYVIAGVAGADGGGVGNSIVVLDIEGSEVLRQDKLCRWNLKPHHQRNYGVRPSCADHEPALKEDIPGGRLVYIADLEGLGRFLTLICADMDYDKPGDWLLRNVAVDWLHAPIMDKSIAWFKDAGGEIQPWIVARAQRAAELGVPKVVVTNSLLLTLRLNVENGKSGSLYPPLTDCSVAFMLDSEANNITFRQISVPVPSVALVVQAVKWRLRFETFPPP